MRIILYTGKGGVGKTSIAASTACKLAAEGKKVVVMSTDQAHSLGDSFECKLTGEPSAVTENLDALEIDVVKQSEDSWGNLRGYIKELLNSRAQGGLEAEELLVFPGLEELFSLFRILDIYEENRYDAMIVDCAPTGETLYLLKFPELFGSLIEKILPVKRKAAKAVGPLVQKISKVPMPADNVFADVEGLMDKLQRLQKLMLDKETVSIRIVTTPEKVVIKETKRNYTWLHLYDYNVDGIIVNKVYPKAALKGYFNGWIKLQEEGLAEIRDSFRDVPNFSLELQKRELKSCPFLLETSAFYGDTNPMAVLAREKLFELNTEGENPAMHIYLPFAEKGEMDLEQNSGEIRISVKNEKRCFMLPDLLQNLNIAGARFEEGVLKIEFAP